MEKVIRNGRVAVLVSNNYGAGWYTWNMAYPECLFDKKIVEAVLRGCTTKQKEDLALERFGSNFCVGGAGNLVVRWLPIGTRFQVHEYDGAEHLEIEDEQVWLVATEV